MGDLTTMFVVVVELRLILKTYLEWLCFWALLKGHRVWIDFAVPLSRMLQHVFFPFEVAGTVLARNGRRWVQFLHDYLSLKYS